MKKISLFLVLILIALAVLPSCAQNKLVLKNNGMYDKSSGTYYSYADLNYEAIGWSKEVYITDEIGFEYHVVVDEKGRSADPTAFLYDKDNKTLLYNSDTKLPTLAELNPDTIAFYEEGTKRVLLTSDDSADNIAQVLDVCLNAPSIKFSAETLDQDYRLMFSSSAHPYFVYCLSYYEFAQDQCEYEYPLSLDGYKYRDGVSYTVEQKDGGYIVTYNYGKYFIYNRSTGLCYKADIVHDIYNSSEQ
jgi:hypothetical protein